MFEDATQPSLVHKTPRNSGGKSAERSSEDDSSPLNPALVESHAVEHICHEQEMEYEGDSSLTAHADFTARVLENAVTQDSLTSRCDQLVAMMRGMQHTKSTSADGAFSTSSNNPTPVTTTEPRQNSLPPVQLTLNCLRMLKGQLCSSSLSRAGDDSDAMAWNNC